MIQEGSIDLEKKQTQIILDLYKKHIEKNSGKIEEFENKAEIEEITQLCCPYFIYGICIKLKKEKEADFFKYNAFMREKDKEYLKKYSIKKDRPQIDEFYDEIIEKSKCRYIGTDRGIKYILENTCPNANTQFIKKIQNENNFAFQYYTLLL